MHMVPVRALSDKARNITNGLSGRMSQTKATLGIGKGSPLTISDTNATYLVKNTLPLRVNVTTAFKTKMQPMT